jgi:hypothetical protein
MPGADRGPAPGDQEGQVGARVLAARQDDQVGIRDRLSDGGELQVDFRMGAQRVEIGVVAHARPPA